MFMTSSTETVMNLKFIYFAREQPEYRTTFLFGATSKTGLAVCLAETKHKNLFNINGQSLRPVAKSYVLLLHVLCLDCENRKNKTWKARVKTSSKRVPLY
jgi:hypothetical protein